MASAGKHEAVVPTGPAPPMTPMQAAFHKLVKMVIRAYYDDIYVVVMDALLDLDHRLNHVVREVDIVATAKLGTTQVREALHRLRADQMARGKQQTEINEEIDPVTGKKLKAAKGARSSQRSNTIDYSWYLDPDHFTKVLRFRHYMILKQLNQKVDLSDIRYVCPNPNCVLKGQEYDQMDLLMNRPDDGKFRCRKCIVHQSGKAEHAELVPTERSKSQLSGAQDRLKAKFNQQLEGVQRQLALVERLLKEDRDRAAEQAALAAERPDSAPARPSAPSASSASSASSAATPAGSAAKTGRSKAVAVALASSSSRGSSSLPAVKADVSVSIKHEPTLDELEEKDDEEANRPQKTARRALAPLPWERRSAEQLAMESKAARDAEVAELARAQAAKQAETDHREYQRRMREELERMQREQQMQAEAVQLDHGASIMPIHPGAPSHASAHLSYQADSTDAVTQGGWSRSNMNDNSVEEAAHAEDGAAEEVMVYVQGQLMPLSHITQAELDVMTQEEFEAYNQLVAGDFEEI